MVQNVFPVHLVVEQIDDAGRVFQIFASYQQQRQLLTASYHMASTPTPETVQAYNAKRDQVTSSAMAALRSALSADGAARLDAYIQREKRRMTIVPFPKMP